MATVLMVHGAFQGGWVWQKVASSLRSQGHVVHTPTLSGCGYLSQNIPQQEDATVYIENMAEYLVLEELDDVVLVGHSYSGLICGALMMRFPQRIRQAVFIDAVIPDSNRSFVDIAGEQFTQMLEHHRMDGDMVRPWPAKVFGVAGAEADWFEQRLRPFPRRAFHTPFPGVFDPTAVLTSHITCTQTMSPFIREMAAKAQGFSWPLYELDTGHCPMITCPEALIKTISTIMQTCEKTK